MFSNPNDFSDNIVLLVHLVQSCRDVTKLNR